jgi:uncharacterized protein YjiS (DUF1127 family)
MHIEPWHVLSSDRVLARDSKRAGAVRGGLLSLTGKLLAALKKRHQARRTSEELAVLSDRMLADIGLSRGDVSYVVRGGPALVHLRGGDGTAGMAAGDLGSRDAAQAALLHGSDDRHHEPVGVGGQPTL